MAFTTYGSPVCRDLLGRILDAWVASAEGEGVSVPSTPSFRFLTASVWPIATDWPSRASRDLTESGFPNQR